MSIATQITRLQTAKSDIKTQIEAKGVTVPSSASLSDYPTYVSQIQGGGGGTAEADLINLIERDITSITIPNGTTSIGDYTFCNCSSLTSVTIPDSVTSIGEYAFSPCDLYSVTIPDSVTSIGNGAFGGCQSLSSVIIGSGITSIGDAVFEACHSLTSVTIPNGVTSIGNGTFQYCSSLASVTIPNSVTSIGESAFNGCSSLTSITVEATTPPTLGVDAFNDTNDCPIYVPSESVETYKSEEGWSDYASRIQAIQ